MRDVGFYVLQREAKSGANHFTDLSFGLDGKLTEPFEGIVASIWQEMACIPAATPAEDNWVGPSARVSVINHPFFKFKIKFAIEFHARISKVMTSVAEYFWRNRRYLYPPNWQAGAKALYRRLSKSSIFLTEDVALGLCSLDPAKKIACIIELVKPHSVLDVGCGTGEAVKDFRSHGIDALGIEGSKSAIQRSSCREFIRQHDLRKPLHLGRTFDLVWCFEVAEHIHHLYVDIFVDSLVSHAAIVALSAAPPGQGGEGHFNEQRQSYWIGKFLDRGFVLQREWTQALQSIEEFYSSNMMVFIRG